MVIVPRWGGDAESDWYPWLGERLSGIAAVEVSPLRPEPMRPAPSQSVEALADLVGGSDRLAEVVLVGHSVGCQTVVRYLAAAPDGARARATLLVAAWWLLDDAGWPAYAP